MRYLVFAFFFLSGCCALVYEVAWMRLLVVTLGVTLQASSCILFIFLGGLALGAWLAGRLADRMADRALAAYGAVELCVGIVAPIVSQIAVSSPQTFLSILRLFPENSGALLLSRLLISTVVLLPPTVLMGASLPFLTRFLTERRMSAPEFFSHLYGVNTLGGVCGSLLACFAGFPYLGISGTIWLAAALNVLVGLSSLLIWRRQSQLPGTPLAEAAPEPEPTDQKQGQKDRLIWLYTIAGLSGFTAISYEVLWTRMLKFATSSSTYAFTAIVSTFLIGLALGSFLYHKLFQKKKNLDTDEQLGMFALCQYLSAIACATSLLYLPASFLIFLWRLAQPGPPAILRAFLPDQVSQMLVLGAITFVFMFVPSTLIGISFPMITSMSASLTKRVSTAVGNAFAANTIGCVLGSVLVGLMLIPTLGSYAAFKITVVETVLTGALAVALCQTMSKMNRAIFVIVPSLLALSFALMVDFPLQTFLKGIDVLKYGEDVAGSVLVLGWSDHRQLIMNGEAYSTTIMRGRRYMRFLGHLPALLNNDPKDALVICFGMGTTAGAVALHPEVQSLDVVELSPLVIASGQLFSATNYNVLSNPKVHVHIDDGRNFLLRTNKLYDFITLEPPPPCDAGMTNLYSREFYALMRRHLKPGGLVCQWVPMHSSSGRVWKMMVKAGQEEFPYVSLFDSNNSECALICSSSPIQIDVDKLQSRMDNAALRESLTDVGLWGAPALLGTFIVGNKGLGPYLSDVPAVTDDRAQIEFCLPYTDRRAYSFDLEPISTPVSDLISHSTAKQLADIEKMRQALRLTRAATRRQFSADPLGAAALLQKAEQLEPDNQYFNYAKAHSDLVLN